MRNAFDTVGSKKLKTSVMTILAEMLKHIAGTLTLWENGKMLLW